MKNIIIKIYGEDSVIDYGLDVFARAHGWSESSENDKEIAARDALRTYFRKTITDYAKQQAIAQLVTQVDAQANGALDTMTIDLSIG